MLFLSWFVPFLAPRNGTSEPNVGGSETEFNGAHIVSSEVGRDCGRTQGPHEVRPDRIVEGRPSAPTWKPRLGRDAASGPGADRGRQAPGRNAAGAVRPRARTGSPDRVAQVRTFLERFGESQPRRAASIAVTSIFFMPIIASNARFASSPPAASASVKTRGVICQDTPHLSLHHPHALSCPPFPTIAFQ
jgi:hypothetical protein